jgi:cell division protein FtsQ
LVVVVTERVGIAAVPRSGGYQVVDEDGVTIATSKTAPALLPVLDVDPGAQDGAVLRAALAVRSALPASLSGQLRAFGAKSRDGIWFQLSNGHRVQWGSAEQTEAKLASLAALQSAVRKGRLPRELGAAPTSGRVLVLDVSAPENPSLHWLVAGS